MMNSRSRWVAITGAAAVAALVFVGCTQFKDQLLEPQNPGLIDPTAVANPAAAYALKVGAVGKTRNVVDCGGNSECVWEYGGSLADEFHNSDFQNSRQDVDQRTLADDNPEIEGTYQVTTQSRGYVRDAIAAVQKYIPDSTADLGEMYMSLGFLEMSLAENFCNGIPLGHTVNGVVTYGNPLTDAQVLDSASAHLDTALAINKGTSAQATFIKQASLLVKARILVDQGQYAAAAALVPSSVIPNSYSYNFATSSAKGETLGLWQIVNSTARLSVSDSAEIVNGASTTTKNALPFASANDPRVPVVYGPSSKPPVTSEDGLTPEYIELLYGQYDPIPMVSGIDARMIEAEAKLNSNDIAGMMTILNALRAAPPKISNYQPAAMPALATPATQDAAVSLFFREKAFWTFARGQRLNDLRRLMRQYKRTEDQVYPTGAYFKGGSYGHTIQLPVTTNELSNPNFHGCIDRNP